MSELNHAIRVVSQRTGLTAHVIRIWEKRYGAVEPVRTSTNRRLYTEPDIERLRLLREVTVLGHTIGLVARLSTVQLQELVASSAHRMRNGRKASEANGQQDFLPQCLEAVRRLDTEAFEDVLRHASVALGSQGLLRKLIGPLAQEIGQLWQQGEITAAHEHFASAVIRTFLGNLARPFALSESAPNLVVATPAGQLHELGAVIVAAAAAAHGWRVSYLGACLPAAEIAGVAIKNCAKAVALSIVYPTDDAGLPAELESLRRYLPPEVKILAGGRAAAAYSAVLEHIGAQRSAQLEEFYDALDRLRSPQAV